MKYIKKKIDLVSKVLLIFIMVFSFIQLSVKSIGATDYQVVLANSSSASAINTDIQTEINKAVAGDTVIITGTKNNENAIISLNIPTGVKVIWQADTFDLSFAITGGDFEVATGGKISVTNKDAIVVNNGNVIVNEGEIFVEANLSFSTYFAINVNNGDVTVLNGKVEILTDNVAEGIAIEVNHGDIKVHGGEVIAQGVMSKGNTALSLMGSGTITVTGGSVIAADSPTMNNVIYIGIFSPAGGLAAYLVGTCTGDFESFGNSMIVEVALLDIPTSDHGTNNNMTRKDGIAFSNVKWTFMGLDPYVDLLNGTYNLLWQRPKVEEPTVEYPVRIKETGVLYKTLKEAVDVVNVAGSQTIEIIGKVDEDSVIIITNDMTIVGAEGPHSVTTKHGISIENNAKVIIGDDTVANIITVNSSVTVTDGKVDIYDGVILKNTLYLVGAQAKGTIFGGQLEGHEAALDMANGASIDKIVKGTFIGNNTAIHLSGAGTKIEETMDGSFYQTDPTASLHGQAIFVQNQAQIGTIHDGYFEAKHASAMMITRGAWIDEIKGGTFVSSNYSTLLDNDYATVFIYADGYDGTGIGQISGGHFSGGYRAILVNDSLSTSKARINTITGGTFTAAIGLQVDVNGSVGSISGGDFYGTAYGIMNVDIIELITGDTKIKGGTTGLWNNLNPSAGKKGLIKEISGGEITSGTGYFNVAISNFGTIELISGGTIIGQYSAIDNGGFNPGVLSKITGGTFWGKNGVTINLSSSVILEPDLTDLIGVGRYQSGTANIFNNNSLVVYPYNDEYQLFYFMSTSTLVVSGISETEFRYLTLLGANQYTVTVNGSYATNNGQGIYDEDDLVTIDAGSRSGYTFTGWSTTNSITLTDSLNPITTFIMPGEHVIVTANWSRNNNPGTGDANTYLIALLMLTSASLAIVFCLSSRKKQNKY